MIQPSTDDFGMKGTRLKTQHQVYFNVLIYAIRCLGECDENGVTKQYQPSHV